MVSFEFDFDIEDLTMKQIDQTELDCMDVMNATTKRLVKLSKGRAPVDTGKLKKSIQRQVKKDQKDNISGLVGTPKEIYWARWQNNGSEKQPANPFLPGTPEMGGVLQEEANTGFKSI